MLFNSFEFIFFFLPAVLAGYFLLGRFAPPNFAKIFTVAAGFFFYGWWDVSYVPLLAASILVNYIFSGGILRFRGEKDNLSKVCFWLGAVANIALLSYFKYTDFFLANINKIFGQDFPLLNIVLPLGISFFTITQLLYLIDCRAGTVKDHDIVDYALFVSFFPHLLAGPILYHRPIMKQFRDDGILRLDFENLSRGLMLFIIGLTKKVIIADAFSASVAATFDGGNHGFFAAWLASICYMLQLYFDFSGYSDMAIGIARMLNIKIPPNFNAPYRAKSIINFWQRWHISLTNAITACIYTPLMQSFLRKSQNISRELPLKYVAFCSFVAFFIAGVWHGAGWHYVIFGLIHGGAVAVNQIWRRYGFSLPSFAAHGLTLLTVLISFVFFRAPSATVAADMLKNMFNFSAVDVHGVYMFLTGEIFAAYPTEIMAIAILAAAFSPPSQDIVKKSEPRTATAAIFAAALAWVILHLTNMTEFLYFQF